MPEKYNVFREDHDDIIAGRYDAKRAAEDAAAKKLSEPPPIEDWDEHDEVMERVEELMTDVSHIGKYREIIRAFDEGTLKPYSGYFPGDTSGTYDQEPPSQINNSADFTKALARVYETDEYSDEEKREIINAEIDKVWKQIEPSVLARLEQEKAERKKKKGE